MKLPHVLLATLSILALATQSMPAQDLGDLVSNPGVFSYQAPVGWKVTDNAASKYRICYDTPKNGFAANINVVLETYSKPLADYVALNKVQLKNAAPALQNVVIIEEKPFQTTAGLNGTRLVVTDTTNNSDLEQTFYFFEGPSDGKFVVTASCLVGDAQKYAQAFDQSMKTFSPK